MEELLENILKHESKKLEEEKERVDRDFEKAKREYEKELSRMNIFSVISKVIFGIWIIGIIFLIVLVFNNNIQQGSFFEKKEIQESLRKIINNGGSIDEIKRVYDNKNIEERRLDFKSSKYVKSHYISDTPLSAILSDLLVEYYKQDTIIADTAYVVRLRDLITSYETIHPFDGLEENQRYYLENIRLKMDSNYYLIQDDLVKLGDELDRKNLLVNKYLNKSEISFWISIIALIITIVLSGWQLIQNINSKKQLESLNKLIFSNIQQEEVSNKECDKRI